MMPQRPTMGGAAPGAGTAPAAPVTPQDPATLIGTVALKLPPQVLGKILVAVLTKLGLPPTPQGLLELAKGGQGGAPTTPVPPQGGPPANFAQMQRPAMQTPSAQPGIMGR